MEPSFDRARLPARPDPLTLALYAAELGQPLPAGRNLDRLIDELFRALPRLRLTVPFAVLRLLGALTADLRADVRAQVADALPLLFEAYPERVERMLLALAADPHRRVRVAAAEALSRLIELADDAVALVARWERVPGRAHAAIAHAKKSRPFRTGR